MASEIISEKKFKQPQIIRIRKEEDEENWISGEELNTDGSSDEDGGLGGPRGYQQQLSIPDRPRKLSAQHRQDRDHLHRTLSAPAHLQQVPPPLHRAFDRVPQVEEQEEVMLWRPKRGSIKLPHHIEHDKQLNSSSRQPHQQKVSG